MIKIKKYERANFSNGVPMIDVGWELSGKEMAKFAKQIKAHIKARDEFIEKDILANPWMANAERKVMGGNL